MDGLKDSAEQNNILFSKLRVGFFVSLAQKSILPAFSQYMAMMPLPAT